MWRGSTSLPEGEATCLTCRRSRVTHGSTKTYKDGCRCAECRSANAAAMRRYVEQCKERGVPYRKRRSANHGNRYSLSAQQRLAIYERDDWTCQICGAPVPRDVHYNDPMAATLDHIEPQSVALIPNHNPSNLRLAHRVCNAKRGPARFADAELVTA